MSLRDRRPIIQEGLTDEQVKTEKLTALDDFKISASDIAMANQLKGNSVFLKLVAYFDQLEEKAYEDIRGISTPEVTNFIRGRLDYFKVFREMIKILNGN